MMEYLLIQCICRDTKIIMCITNELLCTTFLRIHPVNERILPCFKKWNHTFNFAANGLSAWK